MKVVLIQSVKGLGEVGEIKDVKDGYAVNYLFPNKLAIRGTPKNLEYAIMTQDKVRLSQKKIMDQSQKLFKKLKGLNIVYMANNVRGVQLKNQLKNKDIVEIILNKVNMKMFDRVSLELVGRNTIKEVGKHIIKFNIINSVTGKPIDDEIGELVLDVRRG